MNLHRIFNINLEMYWCSCH